MATYDLIMMRVGFSHTRHFPAG